MQTATTGTETVPRADGDSADSFEAPIAELDNHSEHHHSEPSEAELAETSPDGIQNEQKFVRREIEKPENGIAGLKHWRQDMMAGLVVAMVSVPLSLGIALASGAPPICGLTSEIVAGLIFPFLGGAYVTISGPAAGLAPVLYSSIAVLGDGDMEKGYHLILGIIMFAGLTQIVLTKMNAAKFSYLIPKSAIHGMLAAIGLMIIAKQIPNFIGHKYEAHEFFGLIAETPSHIQHMNFSVFAISILCLSILFLLPKAKNKLMRLIPPHLAVVLVGIALGQFFQLDPKYLVCIPTNPLEHGIVFPDFAGLFSSVTMIPTIILCVFALTFVDGTESLATIHAIDQIDPFHRKSCPHKTLFAMGVSNICSSLIGGLTIIPGAIKSTTNIVAGGRTAWVNFYNAMFLIIFLLLLNGVMAMIPVATLSAVLVHIGFKLAGPEKWRKVMDLGWDQLAVFSTVVLVTVCSDLLIGIFCGIFAKIAILMYYSLRCGETKRRYASVGNHVAHSFTSLFRSPVAQVNELAGSVVEVHFGGPVTCFNNLSVRGVLDKLAAERKLVKLFFDPSVKIVDHSSSVYLKCFVADCKRAGIGDVSISGLDRLCACAHNEDSLRYRVAITH
ncbi:MAG: SulP family inorganic anion transporter [Candidatus Melainabacteria bacterium]|nr:SulP family inorganic anion transporter [Candidatus Melainabacteria bacterium]